MRRFSLGISPRARFLDHVILSIQEYRRLPSADRGTSLRGITAGRGREGLGKNNQSLNVSYAIDCLYQRRRQKGRGKGCATHSPRLKSLEQENAGRHSVSLQSQQAGCERLRSCPAPPGRIATVPPCTIKKNAVRWLLFFLIAAASSLNGRCRLRGNVAPCLTRGMDGGPGYHNSASLLQGRAGSHHLWQDRERQAEKSARSMGFPIVLEK